MRKKDSFSEGKLKNFSVRIEKIKKEILTYQSVITTLRPRQITNEELKTCLGKIKREVKKLDYILI